MEKVPSSIGNDSLSAQDAASVRSSLSEKAGMRETRLKCAKREAPGRRRTVRLPLDLDLEEQSL